VEFSLFKGSRRVAQLSKPYFRIVDEGGIVWYKNFYFADIPNVEEKVEYLIRKKVIGKCERTLDDGVLLYDNFDSRFTPFLKHPQGIEVYYELKYVAQYPDEHIPTLHAEILKRYDELKKTNKNLANRKILATAFVLTCRGKYQCPTKMRRYFKAAGSLSTVYKISEKIGEKPRYDSDERINAYINKLNLDEDSFQKFLELLEKEKEEGKVAITPAYLGGLAYVATRLSGIKIRQCDIAKILGTSEAGIRVNVKKICERQGLNYRRKSKE